MEVGSKGLFLLALSWSGALTITVVVVTVDYYPLTLLSTMFILLM